MSQKVPVGGFKCVENTSQFSRDYIENHNEDSDGGFFIEVDVQYPKNTNSSQWFSLFCLKNEH